jgi:hypothetical protein
MKQDLKASSQLNLKESSVREESEDEQVALPPSQPSVLGVLSPVQEAADDDV